MVNRNNIVTILHKLRWHRDLADPLIILVESKYCNDQLIQSLTVMLKQAIKHVHNQQIKDHFQEAYTKIQYIQQQSKIDQSHADDILDKLM